MHAESLVYTPIVGGPRSGLFALELTLGPGRNASPDSLAREISLASGRISNRPGLFSLIPGALAESEESEIERLLRLLRDKGFNLSTSIPGQSFPKWLDYMHYRTVELLDERWENWSAQEIRYFPTDSWREPHISMNNSNAMKYLVIEKGTPMEKIVTFQSEAKHVWGIIQEPRSVYQMRFFGPEGG